MGYFQPGILRRRSLRFSLLRDLNLNQTIIGVKSSWLNFVFVSDLVKRQSLSCDASVDTRGEVSIFVDDVSMRVFLTFNFSCSCQFS